MGALGRHGYNAERVCLQFGRCTSVRVLTLSRHGRGAERVRLNRCAWLAWSGGAYRLAGMITAPSGCTEAKGA